MDYRAYPQTEPIGKRIGRFMVLIVVLVVIVLGVVAVTQFNNETLAMIAGQAIAFGVMFLLMLFGLAVYYIKKRAEALRPPQQQAYHVPPIVIQAPPAQPALPNYGNYGEGYGNGWDWQSQPQKNREFVIVGGADE